MKYPYVRILFVELNREVPHDEFHVQLFAIILHGDPDRCLMNVHAGASRWQRTLGPRRFRLDATHFPTVNSDQFPDV
jgi:hypothetical protein